MRKQVFRRGTAAYRLAEAQGRLPSQKKAKKKAVQGPKTKAMSKPTPKQAGEKLMTALEKKTAPKPKGSAAKPKTATRGGSRMGTGKLAARNKLNETKPKPARKGRRR